MIVYFIWNNKKIKYKTYIDEISKAESRPASCGFFKGQVTQNQQIFDKTAEIPLQDFVARVLNYDPITKIVTIEQRNNFTRSKPFEVLSPKGSFKLEIKKMWNEKDELVETARHAKEILYFKSDVEFTPFDMFRQQKN